MKAKYEQFTAADVGCWADGASGWVHVRDVLANLINPLNPTLAEELTQGMSDDASEEQEALDLLQEHTAEGFVWIFDSGDLILAPEDSED